MINMRDRVPQNGKFEFDSAPERGATMKAEVPFRPAVQSSADFIGDGRPIGQNFDASAQRVRTLTGSVSSSPLRTNGQ